MSASFPHFAAGSADILDEELSTKLIENFCNVAAGAATLPDGTPQASLAAATSPGIPPDAEPVPNWTPTLSPTLSPTADGHSQIAADYEHIPYEILPPSFSMNGPHIVENFYNVAAGAATLPDGTPQASLAAATSPGIPPDAEPVPNWTPTLSPTLSPTADGHSQIAADSEPIPYEIPPPSFSMNGPHIVYHVENRDLNERELNQYILSIPAGQGRVELYKLYVRGKKYMCNEIKSDIDLIRSLGLYGDIKVKISPVMQKAESNLLDWGRKEDLLNGDPRAKNLDKIARIWGAFVCDHFRCSNESEHNLRAIVSAARSVPDYTMARRLVNENILVRLEKVTGSQYRRKRYATLIDWYGIRGMAPIHEPIDSMRIFAVGMHLGEFDVLEEGIV